MIGWLSSLIIVLLGTAPGRGERSLQKGCEDSASHGGDLGALALSSKDYPGSVQGTAKGKVC